MQRFSKEFKLKAARAWFHIGGALAPRLTAKIAYGAFFTRPFKHKPLPSDLDLIGKAQIIDTIFEHKRMRGYIWGDGQKTVLLAHGWSSHALTMRKFIPLLLECGFRVVAFDAPAHGNSEGIHTTGIQYRRFLNELLLKYEPYAIIAHSLGGICALCELVTTSIQVEKVVTLAVPITSTIMVSQFLTQARLHHHAHPYFDNYVGRKLGVDHSQFDLCQMYPNGIDYQGMIVHDTKDNLIPFTESIKLAKIWPKATVLTTNGLDHSGILKDKNVVKTIVDYISSDIPNKT